MGPYVIAVVGLSAEAARVAGRGVVPVAGGGDAADLRQKLHGELGPRRFAGVISVGLAGGLSGELAVGDWVVGERIVGADETWPTDHAWVDRLSRMAATAPATRRGPSTVWRGAMFAGADMATEPADKAALQARTGALSVDMESHVAAATAAAYGVPFAALRVVSDTAAEALPPAVKVSMKPGGGVDVAAVAASVLQQPAQLPALIRTARNFRIALGRLALLGGDHLLCGPGIGCPYLDELALDVV